jgi:hypothetical protein
MSRLDRREFFLTAAPLSAAAAALSLTSASEIQAQNKPSIHLITPNAENLFVAGEASTLRVLTRTRYTNFSRVDFKANGQIIGTATSFPYQITWTPAQPGNYLVEAEAFSAAGSRIAATNQTAVNVLLYDGIGRGGNPRHNVQQQTASFITSYLPEVIYGFPTVFIGTLAAPKTIRRIDALLSAVSYYTNSPQNMPFSSINFHYIAARLWNDGITGFGNSPQSGSLSNWDIGVPNLGSLTVPFATNSSGVNFYLTGWGNLNIPLPAMTQTVLSIQFAISSIYDFAERISFARSTLGGQTMWYASGQNNTPPNVNNLNHTLAVRIWAD